MPTARRAPAGAAALARRIEQAVARAGRGRPLVLAVSGGRDSMVLLHAAARAAHARVAVVATFDHGTGPAATRAAAHVARVAGSLGFAVVQGRSARPGLTEAEWRAQRWTFLRGAAAAAGAVIATAHTRDDQVETVFMRTLRGAGARGLAGLYAAAPIARPLLAVGRADVARYAAHLGVHWVEDPSNASRARFRNRVRLELLPALRSRHPGLEGDLLALARRAARVRGEVERIAAAMTTQVAPAVLHVEAAALEAHTTDELAVLWPAIAARVGVTMDRRGTARAVQFTRERGAHSGARIPLSGGWVIARAGSRFEVRRARATGCDAPLGLAPGIRWDAWRFERAVPGDDRLGPWVAQLPEQGTVSVRSWQPGDRLAAGVAGGRRVKRFLSDAGVRGIERERWPVVLVNDEIVWIPGVRRSDAAAVRPGRPGVLYRCELDHR